MAKRPSPTGFAKEEFEIDLEGDDLRLPGASDGPNRGAYVIGLSHRLGRRGGRRLLAPPPVDDAGARDLTIGIQQQE
jgi:hypothetical protein